LKAEVEPGDDECIEALFWTAYAIAGQVNMQQDDPAVLAQLGRAEAMMQRVLDTREDYFHGAAHLFFGAIHGQIPEFAGGKPAESKKHLERAFAIGHKKVLIAKFFMAKFWAVATQNKQAFIENLEFIIDTMEENPELSKKDRLVNELMYDRAKIWLTKADELF